ncbi:putative penicillin-binding protein [Oscillibacter valericigenes Sjm18-20]|nr:putative penicillin-binding protein [Oscillibacter valericigenes Sjm18-20]
MEQHGRHEQTPQPHEHRRRQSTRRNTTGTIWFVVRTLLLIGILSSAMIAGIFMYYVKTTLTPTLNVNADDYTMNLSSVIMYQNKETNEWEKLQMIYGDENRIWVDYDQIPDAMWQAAVSIEDQRFFKHHGVDWKRTAGATANLFLHTSSTYGGSTITQQLLKNMTKDDDNTVNRKVREIFRALEFEKKYSKEEILELYLNTIYLGQTCYGVQTAAQYYFGKDVSELSVAECASIIAITNNPSLYGPMSTVTITNSDTGVKKTAREMNKDRQRNILSKMLKLGYIDEDTYQKALNEELQFTDGSVSAQELVAADNAEKNEVATTGIRSHFVDQVIMDVSNDLAKELGISSKEARIKLNNGGYTIYSTVDPHIQEIAESVYEDRSNLDVTSSSGQKLQSGITIVDPSTGNVVAMVGEVGKKVRNLGWNYAVGNRQCGSAIKPVTVYSPALDAGVITMASTFDDYPVKLLYDKPWPKNSPQGYKGWTTLAKGVANSVNTVAVQVIEKLGVQNSFTFATEKMNLDLVADDINTASLGLGGLTNGVSTEEMAAAFAVFPNDGVYNSPRLYTKVDDANGNTILDNETDTHVAVKETTAYFMNQLLQGVMSNGTASRYKLSGMACAGKTGTTSDNFDRYFVGYTPYCCAAVWCGYDNNERISYSGNPAASMWHKVMQKIADEQENKSFSKPTSGLTTVEVCADSGLLATDACAADLRGSRVRTVEVTVGTAPTEYCNLHKLFDYCTEGKCLATEFCPASSVKQVGLLDYTRTDYGPNIVADDNAYLVNSLRTVLEDGTIQLPPCPVHKDGSSLPDDTGSGEGDTDTSDEGGDTGLATPDQPTTDPNDGYGGSGNSGNGKENGTDGKTGGETTTPTDPTTPSEPTTPSGDSAEDWWNTVWDTGT